MPRYTIYGLHLQTSFALPGAMTAAGTRKADISVAREVPADIAHRDYSRTVYISPHQDSSGRPILIVMSSDDGTVFQNRYCDGVSFYLDRRGRNIWIGSPEAFDINYLATYLLGPVLGFALRLRGILSLHAAAIRIGDQAIALLGPQGVGKSTTAAAFAHTGFAVLSDDIAALEDRTDHFLLQPGYPHLRLWAESAEALYGAPEALPRITPEWDKRFLDLQADAKSRFQQQPLPLAAIYVLDERSADPRAPFIEAIPVAAGLMTLIANTSANYLLETEMRAREFDLLGRLIRQVPLRRVTPHSDIGSLFRLCTTILEDFHALR